VLIRLRVANFKSIREEQELSLVAAPLTEHRESLVRTPGDDLQLLRAAAIYGANASGKSTLFDALTFIKVAVVDSQVQWKPGAEIPRVPFATSTL